MVHRTRAAVALLVAMVLTTAAPAAIQATDAQPSGASPAATPLDKNILRNGGFETIADDGSLASWDVEGDVRTERFGSRAWPYPAYGAKYHGGKRYLACTGSSGLVRQTVPFTGWDVRSFRLKAHLQVDFGGQIDHAIRVTIRATGPGIDRVNHELKPLIITNHYKRAVAHVLIPRGTEQLTATVELVGVKNGTRCRIAADTVKLIILRR